MYRIDSKRLWTNFNVSNEVGQVNTNFDETFLTEQLNLCFSQTFNQFVIWTEINIKKKLNFQSISLIIRVVFNVLTLGLRFVPRHKFPDNLSYFLRPNDKSFLWVSPNLTSVCIVPSFILCFRLEKIHTPHWNIGISSWKFTP